MRRFLILLILLGAIGAVSVELANEMWQRPGPLAHPTTVLIPPKTSTHDIAATLQGARVVANALLYEGEIHLQGQAAKVKAGEYADCGEISRHRKLSSARPATAGAFAAGKERRLGPVWP